mgnify:CR=1 FL=1
MEKLSNVMKYLFLLTFIHDEISTVMINLQIEAKLYQNSDARQLQDELAKRSIHHSISGQSDTSQQRNQHEEAL